jgi:tetratricopeptide (TPR) repeat protein
VNRTISTLLWLAVFLISLPAAAETLFTSVYPANVGAFAPSARPAESVVSEAAIPKGVASLQEEEQELMTALANGASDIGAVYRLAEIRAQIAQQYLGAGNSERAADYLWSSLELDPNHAERWETFGDLVMELDADDVAEVARQAYARALFLEPERYPLRVKLASLAMEGRRFGEAAQHLERLLESDAVAGEWAHMGLLASLYLATDQVERGLNYLQQRALESADDRFLIAQAILMEAAGHPKEAGQLLAMVDSASSNPLVLRHYASELRKAFGDGAEAALPGQAASAGNWNSQ